MARSVHCKFDCIPVNLQRGIHLLVIITHEIDASNNASTFHLLLKIELMETGGGEIRTFDHPALYRCIIPQDHGVLQALLYYNFSSMSMNTLEKINLLKSQFFSKDRQSYTTDRETDRN